MYSKLASTCRTNILNNYNLYQKTRHSITWTRQHTVLFTEWINYEPNAWKALTYSFLQSQMHKTKLPIGKLKCVNWKDMKSITIGTESFLGIKLLKIKMLIIYSIQDVQNLLSSSVRKSSASWMACGWVNHQ